MKRYFEKPEVNYIDLYGQYRNIIGRLAIYSNSILSICRVVDMIRWRDRTASEDSIGLRESIGEREEGRRDGRTIRLRMVASHPSTSANPVERQNARCRHPLNNEALGFYACLTSPHERSFSVAIRERNSRICSDGFRLSPRDALGILQMIPASVEPPTSNFNCVRAFLERAMK